MDYELRTAELWPDADFEVRAQSDGLTLDGYAAVFNVPSLPMSFRNVGGGRVFREVIKPGAFTRSLNANPNVTLRFQHDLMSLPLASTKAGTMELREDERGLHVRAALPDNEWGRPVRDAIARGDISGMSFRFDKPTEKWVEGTSGWERHLSEVRLGLEVSVTDIPAYPDTSVAVRHLADQVHAEPDALAEAFRVLRDPDLRLDEEQRALLLAVINANAEVRYVAPSIAQKREELARRFA